MSNRKRQRFGKNDIIFLGALAVVVIIFCIAFYWAGVAQPGNYVVVTVDGKEFGTYSLDEDGTVEISTGQEITNILVIEDGYADMTEAGCPDKLCVRQKKISKNRETIVCLPNKVVVTVKSTEESGVDAIAD